VKSKWFRTLGNHVCKVTSESSLDWIAPASNTHTHARLTRDEFDSQAGRGHLLDFCLAFAWHLQTLAEHMPSKGVACIAVRYTHLLCAAPTGAFGAQR
jgi:hypothetical protein